MASQKARATALACQPAAFACTCPGARAGGMTPDAIASWVDRLPPRAAHYARLARFDRPAGIWLLFWPCLMGAFLAPPEGWWPLWPLFLLGAIAMRAAGCVYNDIVDRDLDAQVARTAARPVASGAIPVGR